MIIQGSGKPVQIACFYLGFCLLPSLGAGIGGSNLMDEVSQCPIHLLLEGSGLIFMDLPDTPAQP